VKQRQRWIAVDLDGTLAEFGCDWPHDYRLIGAPIPVMVARVKLWIEKGEDVRIFTARMDCWHPLKGRIPARKVKAPIEAWCKKHLGKVLKITNRKDYWMKVLYDDRAIRVEQDTGRLL